MTSVYNEIERVKRTKHGIQLVLVLSALKEEKKEKKKKKKKKEKKKKKKKREREREREGGTPCKSARDALSNG